MISIIPYKQTVVQSLNLTDIVRKLHKPGDQLTRDVVAIVESARRAHDRPSGAGRCLSLRRGSLWRLTIWPARGAKIRRAGKIRTRCGTNAP